MERQVLTSLATKLGVKQQNVLSKAEEYMRLADIRSSSSSLALLRPNGSCKAALCLQLAAEGCGHEVDKSALVRESGMNKKLYTSSLKALQCLLDLQPKVSIADLTVQFCCTNVKNLAIQVLKEYEAIHNNEDSATLSQALFHCGAVYTAARKMKVKIDKRKIVEVSGVKKAAFDRLVGDMEKLADKVIALEAAKSPSKKRAKTFLEELESMPDEEKVSNTKKQKLDSEEAGDDYEIWKEKILKNAYAALGKTYNKNS